MTIEEAIAHCHEVAKENRKTALEYARAYAWDTAHGCRECANEHEQLADWLSELKQRREDANKQPKVRLGRWVETEPDEDDRKIGIEFSIKCSRCHDENSHLDFNENHEITGKTFFKSRFCPNCGAYMREGGGADNS